MEDKHYKTLFPKDYLGHYDLEGKDFTLTIDKVVNEELVMQGGRKEIKPIVYFKEAKKKLVLNVTNADIIADNFKEPIYRKWSGKKITLYTTTTKLGRKIVDCIRVKSTSTEPKQDNSFELADEK